MKLNGDLIKALRIEQGFNPTHAATIAGISPRALRRIESNDENAAAMLTVAGLIDLAEVLGATTTDLLAPPTPEETEEPTEAGDPELLTGFLLTIKQQATRTDLQRTLGWTNARLNRAIAAVHQQLATTGVRLHHAEKRLQLVPANQAAVATAVETRTITGHNQRGMDATSARTLYEVMNGRHQRGGRKSAHTITALKILLNTGAVERQGTLHKPSAALLYALED